MNKKKVGIIVAAAALIGLVTAGATLAWFTDKDTVSNQLAVGFVDVEITEPNYVEEDYQTLAPGDRIMKDPTINLSKDLGSQDSYIRINAPMVLVKGESYPLFSEDGTSEFGAKLGVDWVKIGNYIYYKNIVDSKSSIALLQNQGEGDSQYTMNIPVKWDNSFAMQTIKIDFTVEAIQAKNVEVNFDSENPWPINGSDEIVEYETKAAE